MNHTLLGGLTPAQFLAEYWQKKPLLVRGALPGFTSPVSPEELAGLACEEEVESRLVLERGGEKPWQVEHGPFDESRFPKLGTSHWTLLVQEINKHVPELALLQERFNFLPNWRLDDVMASFAPVHGTVGPHADNYDVFLIQGLGTRRWGISTRTPTDADLLPDLDLRIMAAFEPEEEWVLEPGDMLYLPPGVAHHGVALENCITLSVGFRAPGLNDLVANFFADVLAERDPEAFFSDAGRATAENPGEIDPGSREQIRALIRNLPLDDRRIDDWFGGFITGVRPGHWIPEPDAPLDAETLMERLAAEGAIWRSEYARFAFIPQEGGIRLFVAGDIHPLTGAAAEFGRLVCAQRVLDTEALRPLLTEPDARELLATLYNAGSLYFPKAEDDD